MLQLTLNNKMTPLKTIFLICLLYGCNTRPKPLRLEDYGMTRKVVTDYQVKRIRYNTGIVYDDDSLVAWRFIDTLKTHYGVEYVYLDTAINDKHKHYPATIYVHTFYRNTDKIIYTQKAFYSPVECLSENARLWVERALLTLKHR